MNQSVRQLLRLCVVLTLIGIPLHAQSLGVASVYIQGTSDHSALNTIDCSGGKNCIVYDSGIVWITVNGATATVNYAKGSTSASVASALNKAINANGSFPVTASVTGQSVILTSRTCGTNCAVSAGIQSYMTDYIPTPSFPPTVYGWAQYNPKYYMLSLLYSPPGNRSSNGFTSTVSNGVTSSISHTFDQSTSVTASYSFTLWGGKGSAGASFGSGTVTGNQSSFQDTYSSTTGSQLTSAKDVVDHSQDRFFLWLNPQLTALQTGPSSVNYTVAAPSGQQLDILDFSVQELQNPSQILYSKFKTQPIGTQMSPGLGSLCANYVGDAACTTSPCGCTASDFAGILALDPLTSPTTPPSSVNSTRYVLVDSHYLEGGPVLNSFTESDALTQGNSTSEDDYTTTGFSYGGGAGPFTLTISHQFRWDNTTSQGTTSGSTHTASVTLGSSNTSCAVWINVYEDSLYHTFAFAQPVSDPCTASRPQATKTAGVAEVLQVAAQPLPLKGTVAARDGTPVVNQLVVVKLADGDTRRIYTNRHGDYALYAAPNGPVEISVGGKVIMDGIVTGRTTEANFVLP